MKDARTVKTIKTKYEYETYMSIKQHGMLKKVEAMESIAHLSRRCYDGYDGQSFAAR